MAQLSFLAGESFAINNLSSSGIGFYGAGGFGSSVEVGAYNSVSFITNSTGTAQGPQIDNTKWVHASSGAVNGNAAVNLLDIPNYLATLNCRFTHDTAVNVQNAKVRIYDRSSINNPASGVTTKVAELIHPSLTQTGQLGSGDSSWLTPAGSAIVVDLINNPGMSGNAPGNTGVQHDHYLAISASPDSIGQKTLYALYYSLEYL